MRTEETVVSTTDIVPALLGPSRRVVETDELKLGRRQKVNSCSLARPDIRHSIFNLALKGMSGPEGFTKWCILFLERPLRLHCGERREAKAGGKYTHYKTV